jgi:rfaE bifunctional protein kinase chain/domain
METIVKLLIIGRSQQMLRIDFEKEPDHEVLAGMLESFAALLAQHDAVLFSDYGKGGLAGIPQMIRMARGAGKPTLIDPKSSDWARYAGASVITPNRAELAELIGSWSSEAQLHEKAQALRQKLDLQALLVTRSEEGTTLFEAERVRSEPANAREVFDVTGAGDTVIATLAAMLGCSLSLRDDVPIANRAGGIVVGKFGTATVSYEELFA